MKFFLTEKEFREWQATVAMQYGIECVAVERRRRPRFELSASSSVEGDEKSAAS